MRAKSTFSTAPVASCTAAIGTIAQRIHLAIGFSLLGSESMREEASARSGSPSCEREFRTPSVKKTVLRRVEGVSWNMPPMGGGRSERALESACAWPSAAASASLSAPSA
eukprot:scaffold68901_cov30-Tisochrysis_lutea.AAC.5